MSRSKADHRPTPSTDGSRSTAVSCNHCGGALDVTERTKYTTCGFCGTRLRVERSASSLATVELDALKIRTDDLARDVSALRNDKRVEQLDRQWELRRDDFLVSNGEQEPRLPTVHGALLRLLTAVVPIVVLASGQLAAFGSGVLPVVAAAILLGLFQAGTEGYKYNRYRVERARYRTERSRLLASA